MNKFHADFPILSQVIRGNPLRYCDNASTTHKPQIMLDALMQFYTTYNANVHRGVHRLGEMVTERYEKARATVARFINARALSEVIFTSGCTEGINFIATTWARATLKPGDEIVISQLEHHANWLPWQQLIHTNGITLRIIPVLEDGTLDMAAVDTLLTSKTKLIAITHTSNAIGTHVDVASLIQKAHAVGARVLIDAAQSIAHTSIDVQQLNADFLVFSGHKICGPTGIGVLYIKQELHDAIEPYQFGGGMVFNVGEQQSTWLKAPHKFEAGTPPIAQAIGLDAAIKYITTHINFEALQKHEAALCARLIDGLQQMAHVRILGPINQLKKNGHLVSFVMKHVHAHDVATFLGERNIIVRAGHHCAQPLARALNYDASVRASFYFYNTLEDVDALLHALQELTF